MSNPTILTELLGNSHMIILGVHVNVTMRRRSVRVVPSITPGIVEVLCNSLVRVRAREILIDLSKQLSREFGKVYDMKKYEKLSRIKYKSEMELYNTLKRKVSEKGLRTEVGSVWATIIPFKRSDVVKEVNLIKDFVRGNDDSESFYSEAFIKCKCDRNELIRDIYNSNNFDGLYMGLVFSNRRKSFSQRKISRFRGVLNGIFRKNKFEFV